jgi:hypothetical protein
LRSIVAERILAHLRGTHALACESLRILYEALDHIEVRAGNSRSSTHMRQDLAHTHGDTHELSFLQLLEESALLLGASTSENLDGGLQGTNALLGFCSLFRVLLVLLVPDRSCLPNGLLCLSNVLLKLLNLSIVRSNCSLAFFDCVVKLWDELLGVGDVLCFTL